MDISIKISSWLGGDDTAFEAVFHHYRPRLLRYTLKYLKDETRAEDLTTEVLVKIWQKRPAITNAGTFENYLFTIARNQLIKAWQKRIDSLLLIESASEITDPAASDDTFIYKELEKHYRRTLSDLPEQRRRIFLLHREENLSYKEIAHQLQISPKTVENQIASALKYLRSHLAQHLASLIL